MSLDCLSFDPTQVFADSQLYVALSRARSIEGLALTAPLTSAKVHASELVLQFEQGRTDCPRWWEKACAERGSIASLAVLEPLGGYPSVEAVAVKCDQPGLGIPWQCAACERCHARCKEAEELVQRTITLPQDRRVSSGGRLSGASSGGGFAPTPHSAKRGTDDSPAQSDSSHKRRAGISHLQDSGAQQEELQAVQDLVDRGLEAVPALIDEPTGERMLSALYQHDHALLTAWRCNKQHPDAKLVKRLLLALPKQ